MSTINQAVKAMDVVVDWVMHPGFNIRGFNVTNDATARTKGSTLMGMVCYSADNGATWKVLAAADNLAAANVKLGVLVPDRLLVADVAGAAVMPGMKVLSHGPARVNKKGLNVNGAVAATVYSLLERGDIQVLESETGAAYSPTFA